MENKTIKRLLLIDEYEDEDKTPRTIIEFQKNYSEHEIKKIKKIEWDCFEDYISIIQDKYLVKNISYTHEKEVDYDYCIYY